MEQDYVKTHNQDGLVLLSVGDHVFHPSARRKTRPRVPAIESSRFVFSSQVVTKYRNSSRSLYWLVSSK